MLQNLKNKKALIVEDEEVIQELLREIFETFGLESYSAFKVDEAKSLLINKKFDIVITDYLLPDGKGTELVTFVKNMNPHIKIVGISGNDSSEKFHSIGVDYFLKKPFDISTFIKIVTQLLS